MYLSVNIIHTTPRFSHTSSRSVFDSVLYFVPIRMLLLLTTAYLQRDYQRLRESHNTVWIQNRPENAGHSSKIGMKDLWRGEELSVSLKFVFGHFTKCCLRGFGFKNPFFVPNREYYISVNRTRDCRR